MKGEVIAEIKKVSQKHREVVLCGVNLGLYGKDLDRPSSLDDLLPEILEIKTLDRTRLSSLEPNLISEKIINLILHDKLCSHLHLPFQSGDNGILKKMNKRETVALYEDVVKKARKVDPDIAISCDIMVGFPDDDDKSFQNTVEFLKRVRPMRMHIFSFSPRENTPLFKTKIKDQRIIKYKYSILKKLHDEFSLAYKKKFLNQTLFMVAEEEENGFICGYSENYIKVHIKEKVPLGEIVPVRIKGVDNNRVFANALNT